MDLIKYYQHTCHLLQEEYIEENLAYGLTYNLYSDIEIVEDKYDVTYLNGKLHGVYKKIGNVTIFNRGKLVSHWSHDTTYDKGRLNYQGVDLLIENNKLTNYDEAIKKIRNPLFLFRKINHDNCRECHKLTWEYNKRDNRIKFSFSCSN